MIVFASFAVRGTDVCLEKKGEVEVFLTSLSISG